MKKAICIAALLSLTAPAAFGQADMENGNNFGPKTENHEIKKTGMVYLAGGDTPEGQAVAKEIRKEMERSRYLEPSYVDDDQSPRLIAPVTAVKDAAGEKVTVTFEMRTARRLVQNGEATCAVAKPANCAREVVTRAEKFMRDNKNR